MKIVMFARHAKYLSNPERLSEAGRRQSEALADGLAANGSVPDIILCSPLERAFQTAKLITERLGTNIEIVKKQCLGYDWPPDQSADTLTEISQSSGSNVLCITHEANIAALTSLSDKQQLFTPNAACVTYSIEAQEDNTTGSPLKFIRQFIPDPV